MRPPVAQKAREVTRLMSLLNRRVLTGDQLDRALSLIASIPGVIRVDYDGDRELTIECEENARLPLALEHSASNIYRRSPEGEIRTVKGHSRFRTELPTVWDTLLQGVV